MYLTFPRSILKFSFTVMLTFIQLITFLVFIPFSCSSQGTNFTDYASLLALKSHLVSHKPHSVLSNWTSNAHFCNWVGVSCSNLIDQRVVALNLSGFSLGGTILPQISNLTQLVALDLSNNHLVGSLPSELGLLHHLLALDVSGNTLQGSIPANISQCQMLEQLYISDTTITGSIPKELGLLRSLKVLRLNNNNLTGKLPASLGNFSKLEYFYLHENDLEGEIPAEIGYLMNLKLLSFRGNNFSGGIHPSIFNISTLQIVDFSINRISSTLPHNLGYRLPNLERLFLDSNRISGEIPVYLSNASKLEFLFFTENDLQGNIPSEFGRLLELQWFELEYNRVSGNIPYSIFNISSLQILKARHNYLIGHLPVDLGAWLPNLQEIFLSHNQFSGEIPPSIANATKIVYLEVANNSFSGPVPMMLGNLLDLKNLNLENNLLVNNPDSVYLNFIKSLENCRKLEYLVPSYNPLNGLLPESIGNLSTNLRVIDAAHSKLKGSIPSGLGNLSSMIFLGLDHNGFEGNIPSSIVGLQNLERLFLDGNRLRGPISIELCTLKRLGILQLGENMLSGSIPIFIENLTELEEISLAANRFHSTVPSSFWRLTKLEGINLSQNLLHGFILPDVGNLKAVREMDLSSNNFSGDIPNSIGSLQSLILLDMSKNSLQGPIPSPFGNLIVLEYLDLSSNALSGVIPNSLEQLRDLKFLNLSFNRLQGAIPNKGVFANLTYQSLKGNPHLCGTPKLQLPFCQAKNSKPRFSGNLKIIIPIIATTLFSVILLSAWVILCRRKNDKGSNETDSPPRMGHQIVTYHEVLHATEHFSETNLIGSGSSSTVYKGILSDGRIAAIKVLNMQWEGALKSFDAECKAMCNVRHKNLVKVISTCSNLDFKAMVLEFMPNGSLDKWLYSENNHLSVTKRLDISIDVAMAMEYLHHDCVEPVVHCDLKPSNVLLDADMTAHVADFGIAKVLAEDQAVAQTRTLGTIGYIAPEYGLDGHVSTRGDVYSFGILLLEIFTRKKPTDNLFRGDLSLAQWVSRSFPDGLREVLDLNLLTDIDVQREGSEVQIDESDRETEQLLVSIIHVALLCMKEAPEERISMRDAVAKLKMIKSELNQVLHPYHQKIHQF